MKFSFKRLKNGLTKTKDNLVGRVKDVVGLSATVDDDLLDDLEEALIESDVGVGAAERIIEGLKERVKQDNVRESDQVMTAIKSEVAGIFENDNHSESFF